MTAATALESAGDVVVVETDDLNLITQGSFTPQENPGLTIPDLEETPAWLNEVTWVSTISTDWLNQIQDGHDAYALASGNGTIDLTLDETDALLTLQAGNIIARSAGTDIHLNADDMTLSPAKTRSTARAISSSAPRTTPSTTGSVRLPRLSAATIGPSKATTDTWICPCETWRPSTTTSSW